MKKHILTLCALASITSYSSAVLVTIADKKTLDKDLEQAAPMLEYFFEKSKLADTFANKQLEATEINFELEVAMFDYSKKSVDPMSSRALQHAKPKILAALLKNSPQGLKELEEKGLYKK
jgi:hypothetical protein